MEPYLLMERSGRDGNDGNLLVSEVFSLKMDCELVTLAACKSGLGAITKGEGLEGFTQAFFAAGTRNIVVTLWPVYLGSTNRYMVELYGNLARGMSIDKACFKSMRKIRQTFPTPVHWAPYIKYGS